MGKMIKIEFERAFRSIGLWISMIIGMIISIEHIFRVVMPQAKSPLNYYIYDSAVSMPASAFQFWIETGSSNFEGTLFVRLFPILAVMPYAVTYLSDIKDGMIKNFYTRTGKLNYLAAKYLAVFVTGGFAVTFPLIINFLITIAVLPSIVFPIGVFTVNANGMWSDIFYTHPYIYTMMMLLLMYVCGGLLATMALIMSNLVNNRFVVILAPFIICEFTNAMIRLSHTLWVKKMAPAYLFDISQKMSKDIKSYICYIVLMAVFGIIGYFIGGMRRETY